jgi:pyrophosphatase PpaX
MSRDRAAYVGDSPFDVAAAQAAGMLSAAVSWGVFTEEDLCEAEPDRLFEDLDSVVEFLLGAAS